MRVPCCPLTVVLLGLLTMWPAAAAEAPSSGGLQELFDLSVQRSKLEFERSRIEKRLLAIDTRLASLETKEFAGFDRVADPTGTDYWESISDTVLFATARQEIRKGDLLLYHVPGIYRVRDSRPKLTTNGECWYFRPDRDVPRGGRMTIIRIYDAPEEIALKAKGFFPLTGRARDAAQPYNTRISLSP